MTANQRQRGPIPDSYWLVDGQLLAGEYPGAAQERRAREKLETILAAGIRSFIDLTETIDGLAPYEGTLRAIAREQGIHVRYQHLSIVDMSIPTSERMQEILDRIGSEIAAGRPVYFHCWGGIGRTGTVAGCWLVTEGRGCDDALEWIRELRALTPDGWKESPQTEEQISFVRAWKPSAPRLDH